jgi:serine/threonine protein kinase/tetratricopeptide (TPR) repeat protein
MGEVYQVFDGLTHSKVALKRCIAHEDSDKQQRSIQLFEREFHTLSQLAHPRVVEAYNYGVDNGLHFYTMELLNGGDLSELSPLPWHRVCALIRDICSALSLLHSRKQLHGDLSPRNIRCTKDGKAKLMDFGAMVSMGVSRQIVGTLPTMSPEVLNLLNLDARTDIYSLGATAYFAITGRHAFPARHFYQLNDMWRSQPILPSALVDGIPQELDDLVMSMISSVPSARPSSTAEIFDRLMAIASLEPEEKLVVSRSYLTTPIMVGRSELQHRVRKTLLARTSRKGSSILVTGPSGVGRSRFLDACVLEARLTAATVIRIDALELSDRNWEVVRALIEQLLREIPDESRMALSSLYPVIGHILPELRGDLEDYADITSGELIELTDSNQLHPRIQQALRELVIYLSKVRYLVLAVDNVHEMDEPSLSFLALLSNEFPVINMTTIVTIDESVQTSSGDAVDLLKKNSELITLCNLGREDLGDLLASVFGDAPGLDLLTDRLYAISRGNPRTTMQLAQHLVDNEVVYYRAGAWTVPSQLDDADLPLSLKDTLAARAAKLEPEACRLAEILALIPERSCSFDECLELTEHRNGALLIRNLNDLMSAEILFFDGERYNFCHQGWIPVLTSALQGETSRKLHLKLAQMLQHQKEDILRCVRHLLLAGEEDQALDMLVLDIQQNRERIAKSSNVYNEFCSRLPKDWIFIFESAIEASEKRGRGEKEPFMLRRRLSHLTVFARTSKLTLFRKLIDQLFYASGLDIYEKTDSSVEPLQRLQRALELAQGRYESLQEEEKILTPLEAVKELVQIIISATVVAVNAHDYSFLESLPSCEPLVPLSPAIWIINDLIESARSVLSARYEKAIERYRIILERLEEDDKAGLDGTIYDQFCYGANYGLGLIEASLGIPTGVLRADRIEQSPLFEINAWCIRLVHHLRQGNSREAERAKKRVTQLKLQNNAGQFIEGTHLFTELLAHSLAENLTGVRYIIDDLQKMADKYVNWIPVLYYAQGEYQRIRGDYEAALTLHEKALELTSPGRHQSWSPIAGALLKTLSSLGRFEQALERGHKLFNAAKKENIRLLQAYIAIPLSLVEAQLGNREKALSLCRMVLENYKVLGVTGLNLGIAYETRAMVAATMGDSNRFAEYANLTAIEYRAHDNPVLKAKYEKLIWEGRRRGIPVSEDLERAADFSGQCVEDVVAQLSDVLGQCETPEKRARVALTILMEQTDAKGGLLYSINTSGIHLMAQIGNHELSQELATEMEIYFKKETTDQMDATTTEIVSSSFVGMQWHDSSGMVFRPTLLGHTDKHGYCLTALAVLVFERGAKIVTVGELAIVISRILRKSGDMGGLVL